MGGKVEYKTIRVREEIADIIDEIIENSDLKFRSRADVVTTAVREYFEKFKKTQSLK